MMLHNGNLKEIPEHFQKNQEKCVFHFWIDRKNIFWKSWKFFRTSRSMQNLLADRMGALRAPSFESGENNPTLGEKIHQICRFLLFGADRFIYTPFRSHPVWEKLEQL